MIPRSLPEPLVTGSDVLRVEVPGKTRISYIMQYNFGYKQDSGCIGTSNLKVVIEDLCIVYNSG